MKHYLFDVIVIGAGPAGVTAAGSLAGAGVSVALIEAGVYAGAENWSGCVYFAENLVHKDSFGPEAVEQAPFERRVARRGTLLHNGLDIVGVELTDPTIFANCYTVLRPVYDPYFANLARLKGAVLLTETTVTSLIRKEGRVIGVQTDRGPLYAGVVFLAEGDASHLVRSEQLERVAQPHFFQGVKAVLTLSSGEIEKRFRLDPGEGAAYELLLRNPSISGRTAKLNVGGFLYTNRDSLSIGYVVPLDNLRDHYRGDHDKLYEWMRDLPYLRELTQGATLSAYGTKLIRSGGWRERPILVEDGLAVGGASAGLGVDLPFPNFTGPASATGLYFARAAKNILLQGKPFDAKNLNAEYLAPLFDSVYAKNAQYLSAWPAYFGKSSVLFNRTADLVCGSMHFLSGRDIVETGRFLRGHILSFRGIRESVVDALRAVGALRLWKPLVKATINPLTIAHWIANFFKRASAPDQKLEIFLHISGEKRDVASLPWPIGSLVKRLSPALLQAISQIYANDNKPAEDKFALAILRIVRALKPTDLLIVPVFAAFLLLIALGTAVWDAFRFYVLKTPVDRLLAEPVMAYNQSQRKTRDLDALKLSTSLESKLATNTYRLGSASHIRTLWPESIASQPDMARAALWWICPARVYAYDAPLAGRGKVTVNFENCIKCESCWRAEPSRVLWGRHTGHKLIYRPASSAIPLLLEALRNNSPHALPEQKGQHGLRTIDEKLWYVNEDILRAGRAAISASSAFRDAVAKLPLAADAGRRAWPLALGKRLDDRLRKLETALSNNGRDVQAREILADRKDVELKLSEGRLLHALYSCKRLDRRILSWVREQDGGAQSALAGREEKQSEEPIYEDASRLFPDRVVKQWEEEPIPASWAETLRQFISEHHDSPLAAVRALSFVNPALGLIAAHQFSAVELLKKAGIVFGQGICALAADHLDIQEHGDTVRISGRLTFVPVAASRTLLLVQRGKGHLVPLSTPGVAVTPTPSIGFRAAALAELSLDCEVKKYDIRCPEQSDFPGPSSYLAIALGVADYLSKRTKEHAAGRIQFPGQMLDTEGRDGIAKLGAVKAMVAQTDAWQLLLETLYNASVHSELGTLNTELDFSLITSTIAAMAFSPEPGSLGYDAGQVFGGFAFSEDDLLARSYRDSSLFRFLMPGYGAAAAFHASFGVDVSKSGFSPFGDLRSIQQGEPLNAHAHRLSDLEKKTRALPQGVDPGPAGEAEAVLCGIRGLLVRIETGLNQGGSMEREAAAAEVLLNRAEEALHKAELSAGRGNVASSALFPTEPKDSPVILDGDYTSFCAEPGLPHTSGSFLATAFDRSPRFVPEMQLHDPGLRSRWIELAGWFKKNCRDKAYDGLFIERYIEKIHRLPDEIILAVKEHKWLATYVPQSVDGLGWHKAEYYILNSAAGTFGDAGIDLLIMASTSIGTTPILLGLEDELPRVREELAPLARDATRLGEIGARLTAIIKTLSSPNPVRIRKEYEALMKLVDARIRHTRVVKYLAANFLRAFYSAGIAGRRGDFGGFISNLRHAGELFDKVMPDVRAALDELPRRERCHKLFLRYLGHNGVSAFALTEPTAGSDSGGVKTTAKLKSAKLAPLPDGRYAFRLDGQQDGSERYVIDADRVLFTDQGVAYSTPDGQPTPIRYDRYDYATDQGTRYFEHQGNICEFHDIGQVRQTDAGPVYEYYSLTGAKMWITNGSIATQFCLYAQTTEGVTGFMADRHSEGLKVGADERKMGQRGSPTNEISIDSVRVPREAVIGYEGHGQVNALETLNVGRCGLAVVSGALMHKLLAEAQRGVPASPERERLLGEAAAILFGSESLAYYLVGLFDRPHESVRMESAIAKFICSEDIHELLSLVEYAYGPVGQTEKFLIEKARRDARILTIYEGTNEVQRFLILKDLIARAESWPEIVAPRDDRAAATLTEWKNRLRRYVKGAAALLGDAAWSDAMLQPALFPLAEMAGEVLRLECVWYRMEWLEQRRALLGQSDPAYVPALLRAGERAVDRSLSRLVHLDAEYTRALACVLENRGMPEVRAADAALDAFAEKGTQATTTPGVVRAPLTCLAVVRPVADLSPRPAVAGGAIQEIVWQLDPRDHAALSQLLELKAASDVEIRVDVLMPGGPEFDLLLRSSAGAGANDLRRIEIDPAASPESYVKTIKDLEALNQYDLIITGADCLNGDQSLGAYLAGCFKRLHYRRELIEIKPDGSGLSHVVLPAVISVTSVFRDTNNDMNRAVGSVFSPIRVIQAETKQAAEHPFFELPSGAEAIAQTVTNAAQAAEYLKAYAASASTAAAEAYTGEPGKEMLPNATAVWAILDPNEQKSNLVVLRASRLIADLTKRKAYAVIPAPKETWPALLGRARAQGCEQAFCLDTGDGRLSNEGKRKLIRFVQKAGDATLLCAGPEWTSSLAYVAGASDDPKGSILLCSGVTEIKKQGAGSLAFLQPVYEGKLIRRHILDRGSAFITTAREADFPATGEAPSFNATVLDWALDPEWTMPLPPEAAPTLSQADVIIDLGYGIKDRSGIELAQQLKAALERLGLAPRFGATRKVTQDLKLLSLETQIGQTGVRVNPKLIIALGISGAPQHIDYIGTRADVLCFNKDPDAPLMRLNQGRPAPRVHPILGDLFVTVKELISRLPEKGAVP